MTSKSHDLTKVRYISLVRKEGGEPILGIPYREMSVDPDLVASFVLAVIIFENRQLKTFTKEGYVVVIEEGEEVVGLLIIDRVDDESPYRESLKNIIQQFEEKYDAQLKNWKGDIRPFREYALDVLAIYPYREFEWELVPRLVPKSDAAPDRHQEIPWSVGSTDVKLREIVNYINGKRSILEIMDDSGLPEAEIVAILSILDKYNWISLSKRLTESSTLVRIADPPKFLIGVYGDQLMSLVALCDGSRSLKDVESELPYSIEVLLVVAKNLIDAGVLGHAE